MSGVIGGRDASMDRDFRGGYYNGREMESRNNPFVQGSTLNREANDVVQAFLANQNRPGRIEDLPSPTGPFGQQQVCKFERSGDSKLII